MADDGEGKICEWCNVGIPADRELCLDCEKRRSDADEGIGKDWDEDDKAYWAALAADDELDDEWERIDEWHNVSDPNEG